MIDFSIPLKNNNFFSFSVESRRMLFAGSRNINLDQQLCLDLINAFGSLGFSFLTGWSIFCRPWQNRHFALPVLKMTSSCALLILFPSNPIGKGSSLAFKSTIMSNKPVFIVTKTKPVYSDLYSVFPSNLFGVIDGYWVIPPVYQDTGLCHEAV